MEGKMREWEGGLVNGQCQSIVRAVVIVRLGDEMGRFSGKPQRRGTSASICSSSHHMLMLVLMLMLGAEAVTCAKTETGGCVGELQHSA